MDVEVYQGTFSGQSAAIKILSVKEQEDKLVFENEKNIQIALDQLKEKSENIIHFFGFIEMGAESYLITEFAVNGNLLEAVNSQILDGAQKYGITTDIAKGLAYLHKNKIIHRDIKCPNIVLDINFRAKIYDFGTAIKTTDTERRNEFCGTLEYLPPEIINLLDHPSPTTLALSTKSDMYSFGITINYIYYGSHANLPTILDNKKKLVLDPSIHTQNISYLIKWCVSADPKLRISAKKAVSKLEPCTYLITPRNIIKEKVLSENDSAIVFHGQWLQRHPVAIKELRTTPEKEENEKDIVAQLAQLNKNYRHIVRFYGAMKSQHSLIFEYMPNGNLFDYLSDHDCSSMLKYQFATGIAYGLRALHHYEIIHTNLNTENILLDADLRPKLCGFGFAKWKHDIQSCVRDSHRSIYTAPELIPETKPTLRKKIIFSEKIDIYSYAIVLLQICINRVNSKERDKLSFAKETYPDFFKLFKACKRTEPERRLTANAIVTKLNTLQSASLKK